MDEKIKLLRHYDRVQGILDGNFQPPIMADVDVVSGVCNLNCVWCCQKSSRESGTRTLMPEETMRRLGSFSREWGIKSWRIAGDSEPTMHSKLHILLNSGYENGIDMGLITNGSFLDLAQDLHLLTWLGISLDATSAATWSLLKGAPETEYHRVIDNIKRVRQDVPDLEITVKFLKWFKYDTVSNHSDLEALNSLTDQLGTKMLIREEFTKVNHKFDVCLATPLYANFGADHRFHVCCDAKQASILTDDYTRNDWSELLGLWGSQKHKELIASIDPEKCQFCTKQWLNNIFESIILDGKYTKEYQVNFI